MKGKGFTIVVAQWKSYGVQGKYGVEDEACWKKQFVILVQLLKLDWWTQLLILKTNNTPRTSKINIQVSSESIILVKQINKSEIHTSSTGSRPYMHDDDKLKESARFSQQPRNSYGVLRKILADDFWAN